MAPKLVQIPMGGIGTDKFRDVDHVCWQNSDFPNVCLWDGQRTGVGSEPWAEKKGWRILNIAEIKDKWKFGN